MNYYKNKSKNFNTSRYFTLTPLPTSSRPKPKQRFPKINLKLPLPVTNWQFITQYETSIYYAF